MKRLNLFIALSLFVAGCAPGVPLEKEKRGRVFQKTDTTALSVCSLEVDCVNPALSCVNGGGSTSYCIAEGNFGDYFGCTAGELIIYDTIPKGLACLDLSTLSPR